MNDNIAEFRQMQRSPFLLTPGPLALSPWVKEAMLVDLGSRDCVFRRITSEIRQMVGALANVGDTHSVIPLQGSGTFAVEAALTSFIQPHDKTLVCINGQYGERVATIMRHVGLPYQPVSVKLTEIIDPAHIARLLDADLSITHLFFVWCETTSGILNPCAEIIECARARGVVTIVDAMSAFGSILLDLQTLPIDVLITSSNKCLEGPPGIGFVIARSALLAKPASHSRSYSLDLASQWDSFETSGEWRFTPPTHVAQAVHRALSELTHEGVLARKRRYENVRDSLINALHPLGFKPIINSEHQSASCIAFRSTRVRLNTQTFQEMYDFLTASNLYIYAKLNEETGSFRVGCIGQIAPEWISLLAGRLRRFVETASPGVTTANTSLALSRLDAF